MSSYQLTAPPPSEASQESAATMVSSALNVSRNRYNPLPPLGVAAGAGGLNIDHGHGYESFQYEPYAPHQPYGIFPDPTLQNHQYLQGLQALHSLQGATLVNGNSSPAFPVGSSPLPHGMGPMDPNNSSSPAFDTLSSSPFPGASVSGHPPSLAPNPALGSAAAHLQRGTRPRVTPGTSPECSRDAVIEDPVVNNGQAQYGNPVPAPGPVPITRSALRQHQRELQQQDFHTTVPGNVPSYAPSVNTVVAGPVARDHSIIEAPSSVPDCAEESVPRFIDEWNTKSKDFKSRYIEILNAGDRDENPLRGVTDHTKLVSIPFHNL